MKNRNFRLFGISLFLIFVLMLSGCTSEKKEEPVVKDDPTEVPTGSDTGKIKQTAIFSMKIDSITKE